jgi:AcrR family transcriptional regulator
MESGDVPTLPRGHHNLSREEVRAAQRTRLLMAMVWVVAERGYAASTVAAVIKRAHISRETFYQHFADKQDCFLTAFDAASNLLISMMEAALGAPEDPPLQRVDRVLATYLGALAAQPALARTFLIEVYGAGRAAVSRRLAVQERFAVAIGDVITGGESWGGLDPAFVGRAMVGAVSALVTGCVDAGEYDELPRLRERLVALVAAVVDGADQ